MKPYRRSLTPILNPRLYWMNVACEQQIVQDLAFCVDFTHAKGVHLLRFLNINHNPFFGPQLDEVIITRMLGKWFYCGLTGRKEAVSSLT